MAQLNKNKKNDYRLNPKENVIETPDSICECLFDNLKNKFAKNYTIVDVGCGRGNLSKRFFEEGYKVVGIDIDNYKKQFKGEFILKDFFEYNLEGIEDKSKCLILVNPFWNNPKKISNLSKEKRKEIESQYQDLKNQGIEEEEIEKKLGEKYKYNNLTYFPEMFMRKIFDLFGEKSPVVLLTIYGFLMNNGINSKRYKWLRDGKFDLSSVLEIPKDAFKKSKVDIWNHILFFNIKGLKPIWFLSEKYLERLK